MARPFVMIYPNFFPVLVQRINPAPADTWTWEAVRGRLKSISALPTCRPGLTWDGCGSGLCLCLGPGLVSVLVSVFWSQSRVLPVTELMASRPRDQH